jgi:acetyl esterase/lipase
MEGSSRLLHRSASGFVFNKEFLKEHAAVPIGVLRCTPPEADNDRVLIYLHGGGFIAGSPETHRAIFPPFASAFGAPILAVDYRLAPENPFPIGLNDVVASYDQVIASGLAPQKIAVAGDSAGGGLVFSLLHEIAKSGRPYPAAVAAFSPFVDLTLSGPSLQRLARREAMLPVSIMPTFVEHYLAGANPKDPRASPLFATWRNPPPCLLQVGSHEILRDDSLRMADVLREGGGDVRVEIWRDAPHVFQIFAPFFAQSRKALTIAGRFLRDHTLRDTAKNPSVAS